MSPKSKQCRTSRIHHKSKAKKRQPLKRPAGPLREGSISQSKLLATIDCSNILSTFWTVAESVTRGKGVSPLSPTALSSHPFFLLLFTLPPPRLLLPPPLPDCSPPCNYHLRHKLKETTIKTAEEGDGEDGGERGREEEC